VISHFRNDVFEPEKHQSKMNNANKNWRTVMNQFAIMFDGKLQAEEFQWSSFPQNF
jgi:transposase-like protein